MIGASSRSTGNKEIVLGLLQVKHAARIIDPRADDEHALQAVLDAE